MKTKDYKRDSFRSKAISNQVENLARGGKALVAPPLLFNSPIQTKDASQNLANHAENLSSPIQTTASGTLDHFRIELKAWIPHSKVVDPEESIRMSNLIDELGDGRIIDVEYESFYRGDNHANYDGSYRVLSVIEFDWDGSTILNFVHINSNNYGTTHRDYSYKTYIDLPLLPKELLHESKGTESDRATESTFGSKTSANSFNLGLASANPVIMTWAPDIDSNLNGMISTVNGQKKLILSYHTDGFPSHGIRVYKNGTVLHTPIVNDASGKVALGIQGMAVITEGLVNKSNRGNSDVDI